MLPYKYYLSILIVYYKAFGNVLTPVLLLDIKKESQRQNQGPQNYPKFGLP